MYIFILLIFTYLYIYILIFISKIVKYKMKNEKILNEFLIK